MGVDFGPWYLESLCTTISKWFEAQSLCLLSRHGNTNLEAGLVEYTTALVVAPRRRLD